MLDQTKVVEILSKRVIKTCDLIENQRKSAKLLWTEIGSQRNLSEKISRIVKRDEKKIQPPSWEGEIIRKKKIENLEEYHAIAVDGSQIYPDKHQGVNYFLINIGVSNFLYGKEKSEAFLDSIPSINLECELDFYQNVHDLVNNKRTQMEFETGLDLIKKTRNKNHLFLFDGSMIFWYLKMEDDSDFLKKYLDLLHKFYDKQKLFAGYISSPRSRELIKILEAYNNGEKGDKKDFSLLVDSDIVEMYLEPGERSIIFSNNSKVSSYYLEEDRPHFFYINTGYEVARVEVPSWIAKCEPSLKIVEAIVFDQVKKGSGYPISLAESHNQAVIKSSDRKLFDYMLHSMFEKYPVKSYSQKNIKKRFLSI